MKHTFKVTVHFVGNTKDDYYVVANNDLEARKKIVRNDINMFLENNKPIKVAYCEIVEICKLEA